MTTDVDDSATTASPPPDPEGSSGNAGGAGGSSGTRPSWRAILNARSFEASLLPIAFVVVIAFFGILRPGSFFQWSNFTTIFGLNSVELVLVMALLLPLTNGDLDLSVAENSGMISVLVAWLNVNHQWALVPAILVGLAAGVLGGVINGTIITRFDVNPFIITLAMGSVFDGVAAWLPDNETVAGISTKLSQYTVNTHLLSIPLDFWYGIVIMLLMFYVLRFTAFGQRALFVGQSREVARLSGFKVNSIRFWSFVIAGGIAGISGVINDGVLGSATPANQGVLLLSVYAAAFLGLTTIQPGRFNAIGAAISVFFLATAVNGVNLLGAQTYVQSLFYGVFLVIAVVASRIIGRRRAAAAAAAST